MKCMLFLCVGASVCLGGCGFGFGSGGGDDDWGDYEPAPWEPSKPIPSLPEQCRPSNPGSFQALYSATEDSIHELITCGGLQMQVARSMKLMIFASNRDLLSPSARAGFSQLVRFVGLTLDNPFAREADGSWVMRGIDSQGNPDSTFALRFFDPATGDLVTVDPFALDSYLLGVTATSSRTWEEMQVNPTAQTLFTFHWTEPGPLSHLLADGGPLPNPIQLEMSFQELKDAALGGYEADYGPFDSVQEIQIDSRIHLVDSRGGIDIIYEVAGSRDSVRSMVSLSTIDLNVERLVATDGVLELSGQSEALAFSDGQLSGRIRHSLSGGIVVTSEFGWGSSYAAPKWECE